MTALYIKRDLFHFSQEHDETENKIDHIIKFHKMFHTGNYHVKYDSGDFKFYIFFKSNKKLKFIQAVSSSFLSIKSNVHL